MNSEREILLEETLQQTLTSFKQNVWENIESIASSGKLPEKGLFKKCFKDLEHIKLINSMFKNLEVIKRENIETKKCEDAVEFKRISLFFQNNAERFLRESLTYSYDFNTLIPEFKSLLDEEIDFLKIELGNGNSLSYISIPVHGFFVVKIIFSIENQPAFVVVHGSDESSKSPFEQSSFRIYRTLTVYFSRTLPDFLMKYKHRGLIEFALWLKSYKGLFTEPCIKCEKLNERDLTGDILPPIIRTVSTCHPYHIKCAPFEIELPDFGYVTLMSEEQVQEKIGNTPR